jgi:prevent-host-death family protein
LTQLAAAATQGPCLEWLVYGAIDETLNSKPQAVSPAIPWCMGEATVRDLRNHGGRVLDRVSAGERVTITRKGKPVARLEPVPRGRLTAAALIERFRRLPPVRPQRLRADFDAVVDQRL